MTKAENGPILFFDGVCGLCNKSVDTLVSIDKKRAFLFAPLQGKTAANILPKENLENLDSLVIFHGGQLYEKSDAILMIVQQLGGFWRVFSIFKIVPRFLRNLVYDFIAKNRYSVFGKKESCRLPSVEERSLFLD